MRLDGGFLDGTFGFPYFREWRQIGKWFQELPGDENVMLVSNEKGQIISFYLPSNGRNSLQHTKGEFPRKIDAPQGIYVLIVQRPQSWMAQLWGLSLTEWRESLFRCETL